MNILNQVREKVIEAIAPAFGYDEIGALGLVDVLQALTKDWHRDSEKMNAWVFFGTQKNDLLSLLAIWHLSAPLDEQSPETIEFLARILDVKDTTSVDSCASCQGTGCKACSNTGTV